MLRRFLTYLVAITVAAVVFAAPVSAIVFSGYGASKATITTKVDSITCTWRTTGDLVDITFYGDGGRLDSYAILGPYNNSSRTIEKLHEKCAPVLASVTNRLFNEGLIESYNLENIEEGTTGFTLGSLQAVDPGPGGVMRPPPTPDGPGGSGNEGPPGDNKENCTSILTWIPCGEEGVWQILQLVLNIMTFGIGILATIGLVISGIQWMTATDMEDRIVKAKSRIVNIVIGLIMWALMWLVLTWLIPGFTV